MLYNWKAERMKLRNGQAHDLFTCGRRAPGEEQRQSRIFPQMYILPPLKSHKTAGCSDKYKCKELMKFYKYERNI